MPDSVSDAEPVRRQWLKQQSRSRRRSGGGGGGSGRHSSSSSRSRSAFASYDDRPSSRDSSLAGGDDDDWDAASATSSNTSSRLSVASTPATSWRQRKINQQHQQLYRSSERAAASEAGSPKNGSSLRPLRGSVSRRASVPSLPSTVTMTTTADRSRQDSNSSALSVSSSLLRWCGVCETEFTRLRRPHRCRQCMEAVCAQCSPARLPVPGSGSGELKRTCKLCAQDSMAPQIDAVVSPQHRHRRRPQAAGADADGAAARVSRGAQRRSMSMGSIARAPFGVLSTVTAAVTAGTAGLLFPAGSAVDSDADAADDDAAASSGKAGAGGGSDGKKDGDGNDGGGGSNEAAVGLSTGGPAMAAGGDDPEAEGGEDAEGMAPRPGVVLEKNNRYVAPVVARRAENEEKLEGNGGGPDEATGARAERPSAEGEGEGSSVVAELDTSVAAAAGSLVGMEREEKTKTQRRETEESPPAAAATVTASPASVSKLADVDWKQQREAPTAEVSSPPAYHLLQRDASTEEVDERQAPATVTATSSPPVTSFSQDGPGAMDTEPREEEKGEEEEEGGEEKIVEASGGDKDAGAGPNSNAAAMAGHSWGATGDLPAAAVIARNGDGSVAAPDINGNAPLAVPVAVADTVADQVAPDDDDTESVRPVAAATATATKEVEQPFAIADAQGESTTETSGGSIPEEEPRDTSVPAASAPDVDGPSVDTSAAVDAADMPLRTASVSGELCGNG